MAAEGIQYYWRLNRSTISVIEELLWEMSVQINDVTGGTDAQAGVTVRLEEDGNNVNDQGVDTDTLAVARGPMCTRSTSFW